MGECLITRRGGEKFELPVLNASYPQDVSLIESANGSATFYVMIDTPGKPAEYTYQWYVNGNKVSGATDSAYTKSGLTAAATYKVHCMVTNKAGSIQSRIATLTVASSQPTYTYSGSHELIKEGTYNWKIKFKTGGTLRFSHLGNCNGTITAFLVGGGAGGAAKYNTTVGGGGGGSGKTTTFDYSIARNTDYVITIGGGGSAAGGGGSTTAFGKTAAGGSPPAGNNYNGGNGGSGGGSSAMSKNAAGKGGSDGSDGVTGHYGTGGTGQHTTTREFGDSSGTLYAGGGGGGAGKDSSNASGAGAAGGDGGGGRGSGTGGNAQSGATNTGGGGGGAGAGYSAVGSGGSGIVVIRNKR